MRIGDLTVHPVFDGTGREVAREVLTRPGHADPWACHADRLDADGCLELALGGFLLHTGERTVLVDVGVGGIDNGRYAGGRFLDELRALGTAPEDVTDVVFTHLHFDHVGWATRRGEVIFANATYRVHARDWAHFVDSPDADPGAVRKLAPLRERLEPFDDGPGATTPLAPGLDARHTPGHTPGSTVYVVSSAGERALLIGDVAHSLVELEEPEWQAVFDVDPEGARAARDALAAEVTDSTDVVLPAHLPRLEGGRLVRAGSGRRWVPLGSPS